MTDRATMLKEAERLTQEQRRDRGTKKVEVMVDGKAKLLGAPGPYLPTPEREAKAQRIIALRKAANR